MVEGGVEEERRYISVFLCDNNGVCTSVGSDAADVPGHNCHRTEVDAGYFGACFRVSSCGPSLGALERELLVCFIVSGTVAKA